MFITKKRYAALLNRIEATEATLIKLLCSTSKMDYKLCRDTTLFVKRVNSSGKPLGSYGGYKRVPLADVVSQLASEQGNKIVYVEGRDARIELHAEDSPDEKD